MKLNRNYITPFISSVFLIVGLTGLFMFFHIFDGYTEVVHEYLGLAFTICAAFHIAVNWKALKFHFGKKVFIPAATTVLLISTIFVVLERIYVPIDMVLLDKIVTAPLSDSFKVLNINSTETIEKLKNNGFVIDNAKTLEDIWINNESDPEEVINLILNKDNADR